MLRDISLTMLLIVSSFPAFSSVFTERGTGGYRVDYLSLLRQEEKAQLAEIFLDAGLSEEQPILLLALFPVRCAYCRKVERQMKRDLADKELEPLMQMHTLARWSHCLVHDPKLTRKNEDSLFPIFIAIHIPTQRQLLRQELTKIGGYSACLFNRVIAEACH
ncbi:hypothetical protein [Candidatus Similichlamydia laticola]|nr:hypothetical protein [Candidatus Similichlamydia laticola]